MVLRVNGTTLLRFHLGNSHGENERERERERRVPFRVPSPLYRSRVVKFKLFSRFALPSSPMRRQFSNSFARLRKLDYAQRLGNVSILDSPPSP